MILDTELGVFARIKGDLLASDAGRFVLVRGEAMQGIFDSAALAYAEGVRRFGREPFLVKKITAAAEIYRNPALSLGLLHARL